MTLLVYMTCICLSINAQTVQDGFVKEYNERMQKTPLSEVEIVITNASSTVSDGKGNFVLQFRTLKPGDKVNVRRIEKLGYEIFNKEALDQWFISRDNRPFTIVMCKSDRFKRIRDTYSRVSSKSYEKQLKKEEARLAAERKAGKLREAEYEAALKKMNDEYDRQLNNLDNYVDRFARIDLSELSHTEAEIIELVQRGKIDDAIRKYEQQHLEKKFKEQVLVGKKAQLGIDALTVVRNMSKTSRDSLFASILRKNEMLRLAGGRENFEKIGESLKETALADTTYFNALWEYALYCTDENIYDEAEKYLTMCLSLTKDSLKISDIYNRLGGICDEQRNGGEAERFFKLALSYINKAVYPRETASVYNNLGVLFCNLCQHKQAEEFLMVSTSIREEQLDSSRIESVYELACSYNNLGLLNNRMLKLEKAEEYYKKALPLDSILEKYGNMDQRNHIGTTYNNLATIYHGLSNYIYAEKYYLLSIGKRKEYVKYNPGKYLQDLISSESNLAALYMEQNKFKEARALSEDAIMVMEPIYNKYPNALRELAIHCYNTNANILNLQKEYETAIIYYRKALDDIEKLPPSENTTYMKGVIMGNFGAVQIYVNNYSQAETAYKQSLGLFERINDGSNEAYLPNIAMQQFNLGTLHRLFLNNYVQAEYYFQLSIENYRQLNKSHTNAFNRKLALSLAGLSLSYSKDGRFDEAAIYLTEAQSLMPDMSDVLDAQGVLEFLTGDVDNAQKTWERKKQLDPDGAHEYSWLYDLLFNSTKGK